MPFSMSGNSNWSYNRFDAYEAQYKKTEEPKAEAEVVEEETLEEGSCGSKGYQKGGEVKCDKCEGKGCDHCDDKGTHKKSEKKGAKPDYLDFDKDGNKDEPMKDALKSKKEVKEETVEEGIDFKGAKRIDDAREAKRKALYKKSPSTKDKDLMKGKFRPAASDEERKSGYRDIMKEKGTQPIKDGKPMFTKEQLEAAGVFTTEEIEALLGKS